MQVFLRDLIETAFWLWGLHHEPLSLAAVVICSCYFIFHNSCLSLLLFGVHAFVSLVSADVVLLVRMKTCQNLSLVWADQNCTNTDVPPHQVFPSTLLLIFFGLGSYNTCSLEACEILRCAEKDESSHLWRWISHYAWFWFGGCLMENMKKKQLWWNKWNSQDMCHRVIGLFAF